MDYTLLTLGQLLSHKDQNIKRQAMGIFKALPEANARIGKEYMEDAMTRANEKDKEQATGHDWECPTCSAVWHYKNAQKINPPTRQP